MEIRQLRVLQSLRRVQAWCAANPGLVPAPEGPSDAWTPLTRQLATVNDIVVQLTDAATQQQVQAAHTTLAATDELQLRKHLRREMHVVTQVAQAMRKSIPGIGILKMPPYQDKGERLVTAANALILQASTYEAVLIDHGLAPDFLAQLRIAVSALKASIDGRGSARAAQVSATQHLATNLGDGPRYVSIMDAALTKALRADSAKLAEWRNAKRITLQGSSPTLVTRAAATTPLTLTAATVPTGTPDADVKAA